MGDLYRDAAWRTFRRIENEAPDAETPENRETRIVTMIAACAQYCAAQALAGRLYDNRTTHKPKPQQCNLCD